MVYDCLEMEAMVIGSQHGPTALGPQVKSVSDLLLFRKWAPGHGISAKSTNRLSDVPSAL